MNIEDGSKDCAVVASRIEDISANGIQIGGVDHQDHHPARGSDVTGNRVERCVVTRCGAEYTGCVGLWVGYAARTVIADNEVHDLPYTGISIGWGWGSADAGGSDLWVPRLYTMPTNCRDNLIARNHVYRVMQERDDGGGIYLLGRQPGTVVTDNHIHDNGPGWPGGIYLDGYSGDIEVSGNSVHRVPKAFHVNTPLFNMVHCNRFEGQRVRYEGGRLQIESTAQDRRMPD